MGQNLRVVPFDFGTRPDLRHGEEVRRSIKGRNAKGKYLLLRAQCPVRSGRFALLGVSLAEAAVKIRQQRAIGGSRRAGRTIGLQAFADMLDRAGGLPVIVGRAAEHMRQQFRAQKDTQSLDMTRCLLPSSER